MGGHFRSRGDVRDGVLHFTGVTSLDDNGGFASIRARGAFDFGCHEVRHAVRSVDW